MVDVARPDFQYDRIRAADRGTERRKKSPIQELAFGALF
jgi:hypothetical protein